MNFGDPDLVAQVDAHIARTIAPVDQVFHEIISDDLHIDIHWVAPAPGRPFHTLVTSGMSERPMHAPPELVDYRYAEVAILLDPSWSLRQEDFEDEDVYWPLRLLKTTARFPFDAETFLSYGHTIAMADPPEPLSPGTGYVGCFMIAPMSLPESFSTMKRADGETTHFLVILPIYPDELALKLAKGTNALVDGLEAAGVDDIVRRERAQAGKRKKLFGLF